MHDDVIVHVTSSSAVYVIRDVFEIPKVPAENNILQHLDKFEYCYKDLVVLMTSSLFA